MKIPTNRSRKRMNLESNSLSNLKMFKTVNFDLRQGFESESTSTDFDEKPRHSPEKTVKQAFGLLTVFSPFFVHCPCFSVASACACV
ncbi:hypothetical protein A4A49_12184 [Nicotiana attenuata]|uniref:Uncharacterized protein n=1 Tax=Nicotiana attenuata TaxID=49451 RepID=A0A1J6J6S1_NICAT|nr:hypothetical protein A4A49_12184 [Nicotiana attenuata]